jgi:predicted thioesterase
MIWKGRTHMLEAGIKGKKEITVTPDQTAKAMGSGTLDVFATPAMIALMENTAFESVASELEPGSGTVGTALNVKHVSATPVGMKVTCETELIKVDGRALTFSVKAYDEAGLIGEGEHERFIIFEEKFQKKANEKLNK